MFKKLLTLLNIMICATSAAHASSTQTSVAAAPIVVNKETKRVSGSVSFGRSNSLYLKQGESAAASWDYSVGIGYKINDKFKTSASVEGSEDIKDPAASDIGKGALKLSYTGLNQKNLLQMTPALSLGLPVSRAQYSATFQGSATAGLKAVINPDRLFSKNFALEFNVSGTRNIHKFDTSAAGLPNTQYSSVQNITTGWNFTDDFSLSISGNHLNSWTYQGAMKEYYSHSEELGYSFNNSWAMAVGHQYGNPSVSVWKTDRETYNYNATDEDNSIAYGQITYTF